MELKNVVKLLLVLILFIGCNKRQIQFETKQTVINAKAIIQKDGSDRFVVSFDDGGTEYCSFGWYNKYNVGDTICWERPKDSFRLWHIIECK